MQVGASAESFVQMTLQEEEAATIAAIGLISRIPLLRLKPVITFAAGSASGVLPLPLLRAPQSTPPTPPSSCHPQSPDFRHAIIPKIENRAASPGSIDGDEARIGRGGLIRFRNLSQVLARLQ